MKKVKKEAVEQVFYDGAWSDKNNFRTMMYSLSGVRLVKSVEEAEKLKNSGEWFDSEVEALAPKTVEPEVKVRKKRESITHLVQPDSIEPELEQLNGTDS